jgi:hypothetical protein
MLNRCVTPLLLLKKSGAGANVTRVASNEASMKKSLKHRIARRFGSHLPSLCIMLLGVGTFFSALAQEAKPESSPAGQGAKARLSSGVEAILRMVRAGVSKEVVKTYIENSRPLVVTPGEVIALKEQSVPDEITTALLKRGAAAQGGVASSGGGERDLQDRPTAPRVRMDPESYEFWWYHYAYPRTLASAYERLYPHYPVSPFLSPWPMPTLSYSWPSMDVAVGANQSSALQNRALSGQFAIGQNSFVPGH